MFLARMVMPRSRSRSLESRMQPSARRELSSSSAEQAGLAHHLIDQRRLAVVDVGNDGHVAQIVSTLLHLSSLRGTFGRERLYYNGQSRLSHRRRLRMLETIDLTAHLERDAFDAQKTATHNALRQAQLKAWRQQARRPGRARRLELFRPRAVAALPGWADGPARPQGPHDVSADAGGASVTPSTCATGRGCRRGDIAVFVRSWYYHLLEGQVQKRSAALGQSEVIEEIRALEKMLADDGYLIVKFWLHIDKKERRKRRRKFRRRRERLARMAPDDPRQLKRRKHYTEAIETMLAGTDTDQGRWHLIPAMDEDFARHGRRYHPYSPHR